MSFRQSAVDQRSPPSDLLLGGRLVRRGAEAVLYRRKWHDLDVVVKRRVVKRYRIPSLDLKIRQFRTIRESCLLHEAKLAGVVTPLIYSINLESTSIIMEYVQGNRLKDVLDILESSQLKELSTRLGTQIGSLHKAGIVHGDLTTSNMILTPNQKICLLDFGLGEHSTTLETRGVDLHIFRTILMSTHHSKARDFLQGVIVGYRKELGRVEADKVLGRADEIGKRGRYVSLR